jgi:hypothetical protein
MNPAVSARGKKSARRASAPAKVLGMALAIRHFLGKRGGERWSAIFRYDSG